MIPDGYSSVLAQIIDDVMCEYFSEYKTELRGYGFLYRLNEYEFFESGRYSRQGKVLIGLCSGYHFENGEKLSNSAIKSNEIVGWFKNASEHTYRWPRIATELVPFVGVLKNKITFDTLLEKLPEIRAQVKKEWERQAAEVKN